MTDSDADLATLERLFLERVARDRARLAALWRTVGEARGALARDRGLHDIAAIAHGLNGAGGTFGFPAISDAAAALESLIDAGERHLGPLAGAVAALLEVLAGAAPREGGTEPP